MTCVFRLIAIAAVFSLSFPVTAGAAALTKPLLPIVFRVNIPLPNYPGYTTSEMDRIADQSETLWGPDAQLPIDDDLTYLRSQHPGYVVLAYLNGGHQGAWPDTGEQLEDDRLNYIQVYRATKLESSINASATQIPVTDVKDIPVTGGAVNARTATRSLDGRTGANGGFISFIRIDDEIMRVTGKNDTNPPKLTVIRATDGTGAVSHSAGANVLAPVYVADYNPDGPLTVQEGAVRYSLNVGTPQLANLLTSIFVDEYLRDGWDGAWLDITAPSFFNMVDAEDREIDGETRFPFNTITRRDYTLSVRASHHDLKLGRIQEAIEDSFGRLPVLYVNNNADGKWFSDKGYGRRFAEANDAKIQPVDCVSLESPFTKVLDPPQTFEYKGLSTWKKNVRTIADATNRGYATCPWVKMVKEDVLVPENMSRALGYGWASVLLALAARSTETRVVLELWTAVDDNNGRRINLPAFLYYNLGEPIGSGPATDEALDTLLISSSTYKRDWTRGTVLVNPNETNDNAVSVSGYVDPSTCRPVNVSSMPAYSYKILLRPDAC